MALRLSQSKTNCVTETRAPTDVLENSCVTGTMLAARACLLRSPFTALSRQTIVSKVQSPNVGVLRSFGQEARTRVRARTRATEIPVAKEIPPHTPWLIGKGAVGGAAAVGLGALAYYGLGMSSEAGALEQSLLWPQYVRDRVKDTYMFVGGSLGITAASTIAIFRSPSVLRLFNAQGLMGMIVPLIGLIAVGTAMRSMPYEPGFGAKHCMWLLHSGMVGGMIAPLMMLGGPIVMRGVVMTAGVVGGLSTIAMCAPSDKFLNMGAPLGIGFGVVLASCIGSYFVPPTSFAGMSLHSVALYGGVLLFSFLLMNETQRLMKNAQAVPYYQQFDPINASSGIYMSIINLFIRFTQMAAMNKRK